HAIDALARSHADDAHLVRQVGGDLLRRSADRAGRAEQHNVLWFHIVKGAQNKRSRPAPQEVRTDRMLQPVTPLFCAGNGWNFLSQLTGGSDGSLGARLEKHKFFQSWWVLRGVHNRRALTQVTEIQNKI